MPKASRGQKSSGGRPKDNKPEIVAFEKWGKEISIEKFTDKNGRTGYIEDVRRYNQVEDIVEVTLAKAKKEIDVWLNDKDEFGYSYGDDDVFIFVAYEDGTHKTKDDLGGKKFKKSGIIGVSISTGDYEMVAGYETHKGKRIPLQTWSEDGKSGRTNVYSGYKSTETWIERVQTTYEPYFNKYRNQTELKAVRKVIRKSTAKQINL